MKTRVVSYSGGWKVQVKRFGLLGVDVCWSGHPEHSEPYSFETAEEASKFAESVRNA